MAKEYFSHDIGTLENIKITKMMNEYGYTGLGYYWAIVEEIYKADGSYDMNDILAMSKKLDIDENVLSTFIAKCVEEFTEKGKGLFLLEKNLLTSEGIKKRMELREKRQAARLGKTKESLEYVELQGIEIAKLTVDEYKNLIEKYGEEFVHTGMEILDEWLAKANANARKYHNNKSHSGFFRKDSWVVQRAKEKLGLDRRPNYGI